MNSKCFLIDSNVLFQEVLSIDEDLSKGALEMSDIVVLTTIGDDYIDPEMSLNQENVKKFTGEGWGYSCNACLSPGFTLSII